GNRGFWRVEHRRVRQCKGFRHVVNCFRSTTRWHNRGVASGLWPETGDAVELKSRHSLNATAFEKDSYFDVSGRFAWKLAFFDHFSGHVLPDCCRKWGNL